MALVKDDVMIVSVKDTVVVLEDGTAHLLDIEEGDRVFYLIRHAEKDTFPKDNPVLTEQGIERANYLAEMLKGTRVDAIYSTLYTRTLFTVDTLAARKGLKILPYTASKLKQLYDEVKADESLYGVVIVGHSNTTPALANVILGEQVFQQGFDESDYDNILIVIDKQGKKNRVHKLKYKPK